MKIYPDTSFLFSLYVADANSQSAVSIHQSYNRALPLTAFHRIELLNALCLAVFRKQITQAIADAAWQNIETDLRNGTLYFETVVWTDVLNEAENIVKQYSAIYGNRSLDVLHIATAKILGADHFITFDARQASLAARLGISVSPIRPSI